MNAIPSANALPNRELATGDASNPLQPATVLGVVGTSEHSRARTRVVRTSDGQTQRATMAMVGPYDPVPGDRVLLGFGESEAWIVGVLSTSETRTPHMVVEDMCVATRDGVSAVVDAKRGGLTVRAANGSILLEHDAETSCTRVHAPRGDVSIEASGGNLSLRSNRRIELEAADGISLRGKETAIEADALNVTAKNTRFASQHVIFAANTAETAIERVRHVIGVADIRAGRIVERARNVYREVDDTYQLRATRIRSVAKKAMHLLSGRTVIKAEGDVAIKGEKIHLA